MGVRSEADSGEWLLTRPTDGAGRLETPELSGSRTEGWWQKIWRRSVFARMGSARGNGTRLRKPIG